MRCNCHATCSGSARAEETGLSPTSADTPMAALLLIGSRFFSWPWPWDCRATGPFLLSRHVAVAPALGVLIFHPLIGLLPRLFCLSAFVARESPSHFGLFIGFAPYRWAASTRPSNSGSYINAVQNVHNDEVTIRFGFGDRCCARRASARVAWYLLTPRLRTPYTEPWGRHHR
jgi:hypothetical protein